MATVQIHFDKKQKQRLTRRAHIHGNSLSAEVHDAVELYLAVPAEWEEELTLSLRAANLVADRMIKRLDVTIAYIERGLRGIRKGRRGGRALPARSGALKHPKKKD
jgi:hypothetical protein